MYSTRRKVGALAADFGLAVLAAALGVTPPGGVIGLRDNVDNFFVFIDAATGDVLWQHGLQVDGDPTEPSKEQRWDMS